MSRYTGKYSKARGKRRIPLVSCLLIVIALVGLSIGGVVAYLSTSTGAVENTFTADQSTDPVVVEDEFNQQIKTNVKVNVGDPGYAVYVRAAVVVTWKDGENGAVLGTMPVEGTDYTITYNKTDWFKGSDGFWYHNMPVNSAQDTAVLINECKPLKTAPDANYKLNVEIIAQTIQALGTTDDGDIPAVQDAWKIDKSLLGS